MPIVQNYQQRVCLFLDILGFSEHVNKSVGKNGDDIQEKIHEIYSSISQIGNNIRPFSYSNETRIITQFSDSIVVSFEISDDDAFIKLLDDLNIIVLNLINKEYLVRGGISLGKLVHTNNIVFGPAINSAYELESNIAIYPRIIFDKELIEELTHPGNRLLKTLANNEFESSYYWKEDFDGKYYLNYLKGGQLIMDPVDYHDIFLPKIRKYIMRNLNNRVSQKVRTKYGWLKSKFNEVILDLEKEGLPYTIPSPIG
ncbi:MAG: hypothetical protein R2787_10850 [Saprospiraceae bacterium]